MTEYKQKPSTMSDKTKKPPTNRRSRSSQTTSPNLRKSPSNWLKSKLLCHETCTGTQHIRPVTGGEHRRNRSSSRNRRHGRHSADFSYDPLSYALNFQQEDESLEKFMSRLPANLDEKRENRRKAGLEVRVPRLMPPVKTSSTSEIGELMVQAY